MNSNHYYYMNYYTRDGEFMIIHNGEVLRSHIKTFKQAVSDGRSLSWMPGDIKIVKVVADAKDI